MQGRYICPRGHICISCQAREEVHRPLDKMKVNKAPGPDGIHPSVLKELSSVIAKPLHLIFKDSISTGSVPQDWRKADVVPIFKKGARSQAGNYRPVSLTSIVGKLMEGLIRDNIQEYLMENKIISNSQGEKKGGDVRS
ncbi:hypothetical protein FKM82_030771 [Ascaphus truei]